MNEKNKIERLYYGILGILSILGLFNIIKRKCRKKIYFGYNPKYIKHLAKQEIENPGSIVDLQSLVLSSSILEYIESNPYLAKQYQKSKEEQAYIPNTDV